LTRAIEGHLIRGKGSAGSMCPLWVVSVLMAAMLSGGCDRHGQTTTDRPCIGVTTSYIECAVNDLTGGRMRIVRVMPPGGCPGHFDISPGTLGQLRDAAMLFRFDFQSALDSKLERLRQGGLKIVPVPAGDGLCIPENYGDVCRVVCEALSERWPSQAPDYRTALSKTQHRLEALGTRLRREVAHAGLTGAKVLSSHHQAAFCQWLGLDVVGRITADQLTRLSSLSQNLTTGQWDRVRCVIANRQEGDRPARTLAERLHARCVVFSNFPSMEPGQQTFDDLVRANLEALLKGDRP